MSYTLDLIVPPLPPGHKQAWQAIEKLREQYDDDQRSKAPALVALHAALTARYPCLCSYADDDEGVDQCPWADGPMIDNFAHHMGMVAISFSRADEVVPFVIAQANALGITVADGQSETIHPPAGAATPVAGQPKPWWRWW
jgi:hypothetical protein